MRLGHDLSFSNDTYVIGSTKQRTSDQGSMTKDKGPVTKDRSAIQLGGDDVQASQDGHDVGEEMTLDHQREDGEVDERRRAGADAPGRLAAVGDQVIPELAIGGLDGRVELIPRRLEASVGHDQLEVLDQPF